MKDGISNDKTQNDSKFKTKLRSTKWKQIRI